MEKLINPQIGDYVLATKYSDADPRDPWYIGYIESILITKQGALFQITGSQRFFKNVFSISQAEGIEWLSANIS